MKGIKVKTCILYVCIFIVVFIFISIVYHCKESMEINLDNENELFTENYILRGGTNARNVVVELNGKEIDRIKTKDNHFEYEITESDLNEGWNYICFIPKQFIFASEIKSGGAINIIDGQANVFVPDAVIAVARLNGNLNYYNKEYDIYIVDDYKYYGSYFNIPVIEENENILFDGNGIARVKHDENYYYNPVTIAQQGLGYYNDYLITKEFQQLSSFLTISDWLVENQEDNGSYPYRIAFELKPGLVLPSGFVSGMAQGQILSTLIRAYHITGDEKYVRAGHNALNFMLNSGDSDIFAGCSKSLSDFCGKSEIMKPYSENVLYEEYVSKPSSYVLNGDLFALVGLYDWSIGAPVEYGKEEAERGFSAGIKSIEIILPYYDYYGWSAYDLMQYTYGTSANLVNNYSHNCHIYLLSTLTEVTKSEILRTYADIFKEYVADDFWRQTDMLYKE